MCDPTALAIGTFAVQAGGQIAEHNAQAKNSKENKRMAMAGLATQTRDLGIRQQEEILSASQETQQGQRQARIAKALTEASAAEAGVSGASVNAALADIDREEAEFRGAMALQTTVTLDQLQRMKEGAAVSAVARARGVPEPSVFGTALGVGSAALGSYSRYQSTRKPKVET
jgi:hypothetical protein